MAGPVGDPRGRLGDVFRRRRPLAVGATLIVLCPLVGVACGGSQSPATTTLQAKAADRGRALPGGDLIHSDPTAGAADKAQLPEPTVVSEPTPMELIKAHGAVFDVRDLNSVVIKRERPEHPAPNEVGTDDEDAAPVKSTGAGVATIAPSLSAPAPAPDSSFDGLDFANWGAGHPPDPNGDVGPTYYLQVINTSIGIFDKSTGSRVAAFTFNSFMSQGHFGNLCDTDNFGDPVVLYDSFENRWFITDFAFKLDGSGNVSPQTVYQCFAVSKTGDPVSGGWNFYSILAPGGLDDYPKFGVWPDGIYMSANMFGYASGASFIAPHVWALDKAEMYAGDPTVQAVDFAAPSADFTLLPANARLQAGTPPAGTPEYFVATEEFLNGLTVYKLHVDWNKISTSTFTGPDVPLASSCWPAATPTNAATPGNALDVLPIRAMAQDQYSNIGGAESLWVSHTVQRGESATATNCNAPTGGFAAPRWYQLNVTGGTVAANTLQSKTWDPDGANTFYRSMPSLAVDHVGDMAMGYSRSNATTNPQIKYAGQLASDPRNTLGQGEQTLLDGTGSQTGNCGSSTCIRWGDYTGMALDPNGCEFWMTNEYYVTTGLNFNTRIGSFHFPGCTTVGNGTLSGTVTDGSNPISGATVALGSRSTTTNGSGLYSFTLPAGTYPSLTVSKSGFDPASATSLVVPDGGTLTKNFTLGAAATSGCFTDNTQSSFQTGIPNGCDLTASPGNVVLADNLAVDQQNTTVTNSGFGISTTSWAGQTFIPSATGKLSRIELDLFCSGCSGTEPNITVSIRATAAGVPTGADLASGTIPGFNSGAGGFFSVDFASPVTVTAGTQYAVVFRPVSAPVGTYAYVCSCAGTGTVNSNPYANGQRVTSTNSGSSWTADTTVGGRDLGFKVWIDAGFTLSGTFVSSLKDANPAPGSTPTWTTLTFAATTPASTGVKFQVAPSNSSAGPFFFVGPDGTSATFFTTSGASLSEFNGFRYLRYKAFLSSTDIATTPSVSSVQVCFVDVAATVATTLAVDPATGTYGGTAALSATLTVSGTGLSGKSVAFTLNGSSVGSATTNASGVATIAAASLVGINAGSYPSGVAASFAGDTGHNPSSGTNTLTVQKAGQTITVSTHAPATAVYNTSFTVAATGGASGNPVTFSSGGACSNGGATFTMTSGTGTCTVQYDQAGNTNYSAAPTVTESVTAQKAGQAITVNTHAPATAVYNTSFTVAATGGGSGNPVTFSSGGACSNVGATFTITSGTGTCTVQYDQAGNGNYSAAPTVTESVAAQKANQTITFSPIPDKAPGDPDFDPGATASSGLAVSYSASGSCSIVSGKVHITGTGSCTVTASQAGDSNYNAATPVQRTFSIVKATPTLTTTADVTLGGSVHDTATLSGGSSPTGSITFRLYGPGDTTCSGSVVTTSTVTVSGNGPYGSANFTPLLPGTYRWTATYSGDAGNNAVAAPCGAPNESVTVPTTKASPTLTTQASANVPLGGSVSDTATLSGGSSPTGSLTFSLFGQNDPTCASAPIKTLTVTVSGNGTYPSPTFTPANTGTYHWIASYSGDGNNNAYTAACGAANESVTVGPILLH